MKSLLFSINKRLWTLWNHEPPSKALAYFASKVFWVCAGSLIIFLFVIAIATEAPILARIASGLILSALIAILVWTGITLDKERGNYDAIHKATVEWWHKKNEKYGIK